MRTTFLVALLFAAGPISYTQAVPTATTATASLEYSFRYSETAEFGGTLGNWHTINPSASLDYANGRKGFPFRLEYAGGYISTLSGPSYSNGPFQRLLLSQGIEHAKWSLLMSDDVSYRPQVPTTGFSGIPGTGEPIGGGTNLPPNQLILTVNTHALENIARGEVRRMLNYRSMLSVGASDDFLHYPQSNGLDTRELVANAGIDFRLNARNALTTQYALFQYGYSGYDFHVRTNAITAGFDKSWTRWLYMNAAAGPQWINSSNNEVVPASIRVAVQAALEYHRRRMSMAVSYFRGTNGGSGYMIGSNFDDVSASFSRELRKISTFEMSGGYRRTSALSNNWDVSSVYGGVQASRRIGRNLNAFLNYTATSQSTSMQGPSNVLNEVLQTFSCGVEFTKQAKYRR